VATDTYFTKRSPTNDRQQVVIFNRNLFTSSSIQLSLFVQDVLLDEHFLFLTELKIVHLLLEHVPGVFSLILIVMALIVFVFNIALRNLGSLLHTLSDLWGLVGGLRGLFHSILVLGSDLCCGASCCLSQIRFDLQVCHLEL
jgi:hypothetical protein